MAIEIVDLMIYPLKMVIFHSFGTVYQRVYTSFISDIWDKPGWGNFLTTVASY
jgi:hypothetical protein